MAEFHFYGTHEDWWLYLDSLAQVGQYTFVLNAVYSAAHFAEFRIVTDDVKRALLERRLLYLWSDRYSRFPPYLPSSGRPEVIDPRYGGPALDLVLPACYQQNDLWHLNFGNLSYEREYCNPQTQEWYKPPQEMKDDFLAVRRVLRNLMVKRYARMTQQVYEKKAEIRALWIGPDAIKKLEAGEAQIRIYTDWWKGSELAKTRA